LPLPISAACSKDAAEIKRSPVKTYSSFRQTACARLRMSRQPCSGRRNAMFQIGIAFGTPEWCLKSRRISAGSPHGRPAMSVQSGTVLNARRADCFVQVSPPRRPYQRPRAGGFLIRRKSCLVDAMLHCQIKISPYVRVLLRGRATR
jgi:hypothetical protein